MSKIRYAIIDYRVTEDILCKLNDYADEIILTKAINTYEAINGHTDIQLCKISENEIICAPSCRDYYHEKLKGINVISGNNEPQNKYPYDVFYNLFCNGNIAVHNFAYTDSVLNELIYSKSLNRINVKQGYTKCSICEISKEAFITDDRGIYSELKKYGFDVLTVDKGIIELPGMEYGFIGGASGINNDRIFFTGRVNNEIKQFCYKHSVEVVELSDNKPIDTGSIIFL